MALSKIAGDLFSTDWVITESGNCLHTSDQKDSPALPFRYTVSEL